VPRVKLVVMQPTYLPWLGYFDLIDQADVFVFLDTVQFEKQSWQQRNRIKTTGGPTWLTVPVNHSLGTTIRDVAVSDLTKYRHKHWMSIMSSYGRAAMWKQHSEVFKQSYERTWSRLADLNIHFISVLSTLLRVDAKFVRSSEMPAIDGRKGDMLVRMCQHFGADTYLSPIGARDYLKDDAAFREAGIRLEFQVYEHPTYKQLFGDFVPFMSAVDLVLNEADAPTIVRAGRRPAVTVSELPPV
jgi:hypothetical protein